MRVVRCTITWDERIPERCTPDLEYYLAEAYSIADKSKLKATCTAVDMNLEA